MGTRQGKISPIQKKYIREDGIETISSSLSQKGYSRYPGTKEYKVPHRERTGEFRTGLDPNATYIRTMANPEERDIEISRVTSELERIKKLTGEDFDLSPNAPYYRDMFNPKPGGTYANMIGLMDRTIEFDLSRAFDDIDNRKYGAITYAWISVHPDIAPSYEALELGLQNHRCPDHSTVKFYVDNEDFKEEQKYKLSLLQSQAKSLLLDMSPERRIKVAVLLGIGVSSMDKESVIFNALSDKIENTTGSTKDAHVKDFLSKARMNEEALEISYVVEEALRYSIYTSKQGQIWNGSVSMGKTTEDVKQKLATSEFQQDYILLKEAVNNRKTALMG